MEIRAGVFRVDPARTKWGREGDGGRGRGGGGGGLTRSYLLLRTSDFHWADASYASGRTDLTLSVISTVHPRIAEAHSRQTMDSI